MTKGRKSKKKGIKKNDWFTLATILAILSGTWMVGAGMIHNVGLAFLSGSMDNFYKGVDMVAYNNTQYLDDVVKFSEVYNKGIKKSVLNSNLLFYTSAAYGVAAIACWLFGIYRGREE